MTFLVFFVQQSTPNMVLRFGLVGLTPFSDGTWLGVASGEWYRLATVGFLHGGWLHIGFNMYALWVLGPPIEAAFGRWRFVTIYGASLFGGSVASLLFNGPQVFAIGASGAIFGLFGATIVANKRLGRPVNSVYAIIAINLAFGFMVPNVDWHAHVGGLVLGALTSVVMVYGARRTLLVILALVGEALVLAVLVSVRIASLRLGAGI